MLVLPLLGIGVAMFALLMVPLWLGPLIQLLVTVACRRRLFLLIPALLGIAGVIGYRLMLPEVPVTYLMVFWAVYYVLLLAVYFITTRVKGWVQKKIGKDKQ